MNAHQQKKNRMTDDIVNRLREYEAITDNAYVINALVAAADEIERLRMECKTLLLHLQCASLYRGTPTANALLDHHKPTVLDYANPLHTKLDWSTINSQPNKETE